MSLFDYRLSQQLEAMGVSFDALIMAAMRKADNRNLARLSSQWPEVDAELRKRYHAPGGVLEGERP